VDSQLFGSFHKIWRQSEERASFYGRVYGTWGTKGRINASREDRSYLIRGTSRSQPYAESDPLLREEQGV